MTAKSNTLTFRDAATKILDTDAASKAEAFHGVAAMRLLASGELHNPADETEAAKTARGLAWQMVNQSYEREWIAAGKPAGKKKILGISEAEFIKSGPSQTADYQGAKTLYNRTADYAVAVAHFPHVDMVAECLTHAPETPRSIFKAVAEAAAQGKAAVKAWEKERIGKRKARALADPKVRTLADKLRALVKNSDNAAQLKASEIAAIKAIADRLQPPETVTVVEDEDETETEDAGETMALPEMMQQFMQFQNMMAAFGKK